MNCTAKVLLKESNFFPKVDINAFCMIGSVLIYRYVVLPHYTSKRAFVHLKNRVLWLSLHSFPATNKSKMQKSYLNIACVALCYVFGAKHTQNTSARNVDEMLLLILKK